MKKDVYGLTKPQELFNVPKQNFENDNLDNYSSKIEKISIDLSKELFENIENIGKANNVSSYSIFLACLYILLYKYSSQNTINVILKKHINLDRNFSDLVKSINEYTINTIANQLSESLTLAESSSPIDIIFTYRTTKEDFFVNENNIKKFDLHFEVALYLNCISLEFNANLFKLSTVKSVLSHYLFLLKQAFQNFEGTISDFEMITPEEKKLLEKFNNKAININNTTVSSIFDINSKKTKVHILDANMKHIPIGNVR